MPPAHGAWTRRIASLTDGAPAAARRHSDKLHSLPRNAAGSGSAGLLLQAPDLLLLDDPAADLDAEAAAWLDRHLAAYRGTVVAATRDRCFLDGVADWILELDGGTGAAWRGGYASWLEQKREQLDGAAGPAGDRRHAVQREIEWLRMPARVRTANARAHMQDRAGASAGSAVVEAENLIKGSGTRALVGGLSFALPPGAIAGVPGPGRCGKTTLLRLIAGEATPDAGAIRLGPDVRAALVVGPDGGPHPDPVVRLAELQGDGVNLVLLDEPERGLDIDGLRALEEALLAFPRHPHCGHGRPPAPRPHRDPHPGFRGRQPGGVVPRRLRGLRGRPPPPSGKHRRPAPPDSLPQVNAQIAQQRPAPPATCSMR